MVRNAFTIASRLASTALSASGIRTDIHHSCLLVAVTYRSFDGRHKGLANIGNRAGGFAIGSTGGDARTRSARHEIDSCGGNRMGRDGE
jgi:hypothetical protein